MKEVLFSEHTMILTKNKYRLQGLYSAAETDARTYGCTWPMLGDYCARAHSEDAFGIDWSRSCVLDQPQGWYLQIAWMVQVCDKLVGSGCSGHK